MEVAGVEEFETEGTLADAVGEGRGEERGAGEIESVDEVMISPCKRLGEGTAAVLDAERGECWCDCCWGLNRPDAEAEPQEAKTEAAEDEYEAGDTIDGVSDDKELGVTEWGSGGGARVERSELPGKSGPLGGGQTVPHGIVNAAGADRGAEAEVGGRLTNILDGKAAVNGEIIPEDGAGCAAASSKGNCEVEVG